MNLYLLERKNSALGHAEQHSIVVSAYNMKAARLLAAREAGDEGPGVWLSPDSVRCVLLTTKYTGVTSRTSSNNRIICRDFCEA